MENNLTKYIYKMESLCCTPETNTILNVLKIKSNEVEVASDS